MAQGFTGRPGTQLRRGPSAPLAVGSRKRARPLLGGVAPLRFAASMRLLILGGRSFGRSLRPSGLSAALSSPLASLPLASRSPLRASPLRRASAPWLSPVALRSPSGCSAVSGRARFRKVRVASPRGRARLVGSLRARCANAHLPKAFASVPGLRSKERVGVVLAGCAASCALWVRICFLCRPRSEFRSFFLRWLAPLRFCGLASLYPKGKFQRPSSPELK